MKFTLLVVFCAVSITASAQFWKKKPVPVVYPRYEQLPDATAILSVNILDNQIAMPGVVATTLKRSRYDIELAEEAVMKLAKHNMHYALYAQASDNFTELAELYILQNRFSEAKWYLLQSKELSRVQKNHKRTISNLLDLAAIKLAIGEMALAKTDLLEARDLATLNNLPDELAATEQRIHDLEFNKQPAEKAALRYAEAVETANKLPKIN